MSNYDQTKPDAVTLFDQALARLGEEIRTSTAKPPGRTRRLVSPNRPGNPRISGGTRTRDQTIQEGPPLRHIPEIPIPEDLTPEKRETLEQLNKRIQETNYRRKTSGRQGVGRRSRHYSQQQKNRKKRYANKKSK